MLDDILGTVTKHTPVIITIAGALGTIVAGVDAAQAEEATAFLTHAGTVAGTIVTSVGLIATAFIHSVNATRPK